MNDKVEKRVGAILGTQARPEKFGQNMTLLDVVKVI